MTPQEQQREITMMFARMNLDSQAAIHVLTDVLAEVLSRLDSRAKSDVLSELAQKIQAEQERGLLAIEKMNPGVAAQMDKHTPPPAL